MSSGRIKVCWVAYISSLSILVLGISPYVLCVDGDDYSQTGNPALVPLVTNHIYDQTLNLTVVFHDDIKTELDYCIKDVDDDLNSAFNFSKDLEFLNNCVKQTKGDITQRICTAAEMKFYFTSFYKKEKNKVSYLKTQ